MRARADLPIAQLPTQTEVSIPVEIVHGVRPGPRLWVSAAIHGDEINGVEIVRELLQLLDPQQMTGAVIAVPIVNVFGFINESRYLPDRRDLNRSFPGSDHGSLAARIAHRMMTEIVGQSTHGIDLHTGSNGRTNWPHIRGDLTDPATLAIAEAFAAPVMLDKKGPRRSLRREALELGKAVLTFEGGEPGRFDERAVEVGLAGVLRVMEALGMVAGLASPVEAYAPRQASGKTWVRARQAGIFRLVRRSGDCVEKGELLGIIGDAFQHEATEIHAPTDGMIISHVTNPLVHQGDALMHLVRFED